MLTIDNPFEIKNLKEIPLPRAPLIRVIAQVRFPTIVSIEDSKYIAQFQESLRATYPILKTEKRLVVNLLNPQDKREETIWRFFDSTEKWRITLAPEFLALETWEYKSRDDFFGRFEKAVSDLAKSIQPTKCDRIGVRYIDQVTGNEFDNISNLVRAEVLGIYGTNLKSYISSSLRQTVFSINEDFQLSARWGVLGKMQTYDPGTVSPIDSDSWVLDLDVFAGKKQDFVPKNIVEQSKKLATHAYHFFRWSVNDHFLTAYGGKLK